MKRRFWDALALAGALLFLGQGVRAQTQTNVTATVKDPLGIPYSNGTYSVQLIPTGSNPSVNGQGIGGAFNGRLDATGSFNISLWPNASISPGGTTWQFTICVSPGVAPPLGTGGQCTPPTVVTIVGASQSLNATLSAVAPGLTAIDVGGSSGITGTISVNQIAFGTGANIIGGSPAFTYTTGTQFLNLLGVTGGGSFLGIPTIARIDSSTGAAWNLVLTDASAPAGSGFTFLLDSSGDGVIDRSTDGTVATTNFMDFLVNGDVQIGAIPSSGDILTLLHTGGATLFNGPLTIGSDGTIAGTLQLANGAGGGAHTILGSAATTTNTILGFATAPVTGDLISCTVAATTCTLTDSGILGTNIVRTNQSNVYTTGLQDFTAATMEIPEAAGFTANVNSTIGLDTTANAVHFFVNNADALNVVEAVGITANVLPKSTNATQGLITASLATDNGTTFTYTGTGGVTAPALGCGVLNTTSCVITGFGSTSGTATITWPAVAGTSTNPIAISNSLQLPSGTVYNWNGDTGLSRDSAGVVDVGTGAAGSKAGSLNLTGLTATGVISTSQAGVLSQAAFSMTGAPITGGTGTTTFPLAYLNAGAAVTTFNTNGTEIGINAPSGFTGFFMDLHLNGGASLFSLSSGGSITTQGGIRANNFSTNTAGHIFISQTAPTIASGFGTTPSIPNNNGTAAFTVNVGTGGTASSGVITMPAATTGWACVTAPNAAPQAAAVTYSAPTSTTSITLTNYTLTTGIALAWTSGFVLQVLCSGY